MIEQPFSLVLGVPWFYREPYAINRRAFTLGLAKDPEYLYRIRRQNAINQNRKKRQ